MAVQLGSEDMFSRNADQIKDIILFSQVISIDYNTDPITVHCKDGSQHQGSKVIVTVPLAILKDRRIEFTPPLPSEKTEALDSLGVGQVEKVFIIIYDT